MSSGLTITAISPVAPDRSESDPRPAPVAAPTPQSIQAGTPNPTLLLDPALGLVVLQFRDDDETLSIPSQQQLDAYRVGTETPPGAAKPPAVTAPPIRDKITV